MQITEEQLHALVDQRVAQIQGQKRPLTPADEALKKSGDINQVNVTWRYQEYPKHLFSELVPESEPVDGLHFIEVATATEEAEALAKGWQRTPPVRPFEPLDTIHDAPKRLVIPDAPVASSRSTSTADAPAASRPGRVKKEHAPALTE